VSGPDWYSILQVTSGAEPEVIRAAYRALAQKYHPDRTSAGYAAQRMAELNRAWAVLGDPASRAEYDRSRRPVIAGVSVPTAMHQRGAPPAPAGDDRTSRLSFGRYRGWSLNDLARRDPDYLTWLSRHSSGIRYRTEIYQILRTMGMPAA
jgi:curved DNA-binding protein CbpA